MACSVSVIKQEPDFHASLRHTRCGSAQSYKYLVGQQIKNPSAPPEAAGQRPAVMQSLQHAGASCIIDNDGGVL